MQSNPIPGAPNPSPVQSPDERHEKRPSSEGAWGTLSFSLGLSSALISGFTTMGAYFSETYSADGYALLGICTAALLGIAGIVCSVVSSNRDEDGGAAVSGLLLNLAFVPISFSYLVGLFKLLSSIDGEIRNSVRPGIEAGKQKNRKASGFLTARKGSRVVLFS